MSEESFVKGMRLAPNEVAALDRYVGLIEQADRSRMDFIKSDAVAFTPGALLVVAVAKFVYDVYQDYGKVAITSEGLQAHFKSIAQELARLESGGVDAVSLDTYARLRRELVAARKG